MTDQVRIKELKVPMSALEDDAFRKFCNSIGTQRAPFARMAIADAMRTHVTHWPMRKERPSHGHLDRRRLQLPSCRLGRGGAPAPRLQV